jgi:hypothetical protein
VNGGASAVEPTRSDPCSGEMKLATRAMQRTTVERDVLR